MFILQSKQSRISPEQIEASMARGNMTYKELSEDLKIPMSTLRGCVRKYGLYNKIPKQTRTQEDIFADLTNQYKALRQTKEAADIQQKDFVTPNGKPLDVKIINKWASIHCAEYRDSRKKMNRVFYDK